MATMESIRKRGLGRDLWSTACHLADAASSKDGYRVGTDQVFRALAGRRQARGRSAVRAACEEAGFFVPLCDPRER